jgi:hypothetical protein
MPAIQVLRRSFLVMLLRQCVGVSLVLAFLQGGSAWAATYWVSKQGADSNPCFASNTEPDLATRSRLSIKAGAACLGAGDTLMVKPGNYNEQVADPLPNGAMLRGSDPNNWPVLKPTSINKGSPYHSAGFRMNSSRTRTITFKYIKVDFSLITSGNKASNCWHTGNVNVPLLLEDFECIGPANGMASAYAAGIGASGYNTTGWIIRRGMIKNWVSCMCDPENPGAHGFYFGASNSTIEHVRIENVNGACVNWRSGLPVSNNTFRFNYCKDTAAGVGGDYGANGTNNLMHNNVFWNVKGIEIRDSAQRFLNNTVYGDPSFGRCIRLRDSGHTVRNNIFLNCGGTPIVNQASQSTVSHNLTTGTASNIFTNHAKGDFSLKVGSPAIDAGIALSGIDCNGTCDQGAYEYGLSTFQPQASNSSTSVSAPANLQATAQ